WRPSRHADMVCTGAVRTALEFGAVPLPRLLVDWARLRELTCGAVPPTRRRPGWLGERERGDVRRPHPRARAAIDEFRCSAGGGRRTRRAARAVIHPGAGPVRPFLLPALPRGAEHRAHPPPARGERGRFLDVGVPSRTDPRRPVRRCAVAAELLADPTGEPAGIDGRRPDGSGLAHGPAAPENAAE